jgi:hypothetical protein
MSSFFEDLTDLIVETPPGKVFGVALLIMIFATAVVLGTAYWIIHRH